MIDATEIVAEAPPRRPVFTGAWAVAQLIPSPEVAIGRTRTHTQTGGFGMRWQVTPLAWSFGLHRRVHDRLRMFLVDPAARQSGSLETFLSPEYLDLGQKRSDQLSVRLGARAYFPVLHKGEYLSVSLGTSWSSLGGGGVGYELGVYALFGVLGVQVTLSPSPEQPPCIATLRFRYF